MAQKLNDSVVREILRLYDNQTEIPEIGLHLNLKKMQVSAIIAHSQLGTAPQLSQYTDKVQSTEPNDTDSQTMSDLDRSALVEEYSVAENSTLNLAPATEAEELDKEEDEGIFIGKDKDYTVALLGIQHK